MTNQVKSVKLPVGLAPLVSRVEEICKNAERYRGTEIVKPPHLLLALDAGEGRTTAASYIARAYQANRVRSFSGLERMLEYELDGTMAGVRAMLTDVQANAVYANHFAGVLAIDPAALAAHLPEAQTALFLRKLPELGRDATLVLFVPVEQSRNLAQLTQKIRSALPDLEAIGFSAYTERELAEITGRVLENDGVELAPEGLDEALLQAVRNARGKTAKDAERLARTLAQRAALSAGATSFGAAAFGTAQKKEAGV